MTTKVAIEDFISQRTFAIVGVSRGAKKFGNSIFRELTSHGYKLYPIHPEAKTLEVAPAYKDFVVQQRPGRHAHVVHARSGGTAQRRVPEQVDAVQVTHEGRGGGQPAGIG